MMFQLSLYFVRLQALFLVGVAGKACCTVLRRLCSGCFVTRHIVKFLKLKFVRNIQSIRTELCRLFETTNPLLTR